MINGFPNHAPILSIPSPPTAAPNITPPRKQRQPKALFISIIIISSSRTRNFTPAPIISHLPTGPPIPHIIISRKVTPPQLSLIPIIVLSSCPTNYASVPTTSPTISKQVTPLRQQFIPFTVPAPETPAIPPTEIIFPGSPTNFTTNSINFKEEALRVLPQFISITTLPSSHLSNFVPALPVQG